MGTKALRNEDTTSELLTLGPVGGLDTTTAPFFVSPSSFTDGENFVPNRSYGGYTTVQGRANAFTNTLPFTPTAVFCMDTVGAADVYLFYGVNAGHGQIWKGSIGGALSQVTTPTMGNNPKGVFAKLAGWVFFTNGADTPLKIDASLNVTNWGIVKPATAPTIVSGGAGNLLGNYVYCVTFGVSSTGQESSQGLISGVFTATNNSAALSSIPISTDTQVNQRNIYRLGGALGQWRLIGTINDNTTTTFTDNTADINVTGQSLTIFRDPPPAFTFIATHQGRIFGFGTPTDSCRVWWSNFNEPWGFNANTGNLPVDSTVFDDGAVAMASTGGTLILFKKRTTHAVWGTTDADFQVYFLFKRGCISAQSVAAQDGVVYWIARQGVYFYVGGGGFDPVQNKVSDGNYQQSNIKSVLDGLSMADRAAAVGFFYDSMYHLSLPTLNKTYVFDLRQRAWYRMGFATSAAWFDNEDSVLVVAANLQTLGQVDQWFAADTDLGGAITSYITTRISSADGRAPQNANATKRYRYFVLEAPVQPGASASVTVTVNPGASQIPQILTAIDLGSGQPRHQESLKDTMLGVTVQFTITLTTTSKTVLEYAAVLGWTERVNIENG